MTNRIDSSPAQANFLNLQQARWLVGVLTMLIAVVGKDSLLGLVLKQTRLEISTLVQAEEQDDPAGRDWHTGN